MYEVIPENITFILLKRLFVFICLFSIVMAIVYFHVSMPWSHYPSNSGDNFLEISKSDIFFNS